ncbi:MAG: hypothetical protein KKB31_03200 [Nanoarchaeota archaeon]|nr:hypothetical protein [Nanoarchaeota archaeon]
MRQFDTGIMNVCWKYLEIVASDKQPHLKINYDAEKTIIEVYKGRSCACDSQTGLANPRKIVSSGLVGILTIKEKSVNFDWTDKSSFKNYVLREIGRFK